MRPRRRSATLLRRAALLAALAAASLGPAPQFGAAEPVFDARILHETRIEMDPADWQALRDNFRTNQYYSANVSLDGQVVEQVGLRSRGKGSRDPDKPGLRLDFNRYGRDRDFHAMKSLVLDNEIQDSSLLREALAYAVFQAMGIEAPQIAYTRVTVNGEYWGVYAQTEDVRKSFLSTRFGSDTGDLFSYEWPGFWDFSWRGEDPEAYVPEPFEPHTNEDTIDPGQLIAFVRTINEAADETFVQEVSAFVDVERFLTYIATENALAESDGMLGDQGINNFYLYQPAPGARFVFIPWDKDTSFQEPEWPLFKGVEQNLLARRLLAFEPQRAFYMAQVQRAVSQYVNASYLLPRLDASYRLIREAVLSDTRKPQSNDEFELSVVGLRGVIEGRRVVAAESRRLTPRR